MRKIRLLTALGAMLMSVIPAAADYIMEAGDGHTVTVSDPFYFYDDGGPDSPFTKNFSGTVTFVPQDPSKAVKVNAEEFGIGAGRMYLFSGTGTDEANALGNAAGYFVSTGPKDLVSVADDGALTVKVACKGASAYTQGWKILVSLTEKPRPQLEPMSGTYRVGPSADARFANLAELEKAFEAGVSGPVTIELEDGFYDENFLIKDVAGVSETNTLTITSVAGSAAGCVICGSTKVLDYQGTVCVDNTPYVTFSNITVAAPEGNGSRTPYAALQLRNGSHHCRVEQCVVSAPLVSANDNRTYVLMANAGQDAASTCDWLTVTGTRIEGGYVGFYAGTDPEGDSGLTTTGLVFTGNDIANVALRSAQIVECDGFSFTGNSITPGSAGKKSAHHLELRKPTGAFRVEANKLLIGQGSECTGIYLRDGGGSADAANPAIIANNVIAMPKVAEAYSYGMMVDAAMTNVVIAHNSVCLTSASTTLRNVYAMAFNGTSAPEGVAPQIVNNMLSAGLSGMPLRPWNDSHYARLAFAGNVYYSACGYIDGDSKDIAQYRQATGDASSVWAQPEFMSTSDLHLAEVADDMYVASTPWVTVDYDGRQRSVTTVAGAYEYERQMVEKPVMAEGYPQIYAVTDKKVTVKSKWSVGGMLYVKAVDESDAIPSPEAMKTATAATAVDADREVVSEFTGLQPSTSYRACFMLESALGQLSDIVVSDVFVTPDEIQPLEAFIYWQDEPFMAGENVELMAVAEGGVMPYVYTWTDQAGNIIGSDETIGFEAEINGTYRLAVKSADGQSVVCKVHVPVVSEELTMATFDDLELAAESYWQYDQALATGGMFTDQFFSGSFAFGNTSMPSYSFWSGYGYANETATDFVALDNQMRNVVGGGAMDTKAYGVAYIYGADTRISLSVPDAGVTVPGMYVTNSAYALSSMVYGDGFSAKFESGDYQELKIEGFLGDQETGCVTVLLADYRGESPALLTDWRWVDLSNLGAVTSIRLSLDGTKYDTVPGYVCVDQIGAPRPSVGIDEVTDGSDSAEPVYYDITGRRLVSPSKGVYIVVRGNKVTKEYLR